MPKLFATGKKSVPVKRETWSVPERWHPREWYYWKTREHFRLTNPSKQLHCSVTVQEEPSKAELVREMSTAALW